MLNYKYVNFPNIGYMQVILSDEQLKPIKDEINDIKNNNYDDNKKLNYTLAGNIEKEYKLSECFKYVENLLLPLVHAYINIDGHKQSIVRDYKKLGIQQEDLSELQLLELWVNYQTKHEFNPLHNHSGVVSFTLWIDIPYSIEEENTSPSVKNSNSPRAGCFEFAYTNIINEQYYHLIPADKKYNSGLIMFPAKLYHTVYPFYTSDKYRISVAGNFGHKLK